MQLRSGQNVSESEVRFLPETYHFYDGTGRDITDDILFRDKLRLVPGFDVEEENRRLSRERGVGGNSSKLSESTLGIFTKQIVTDPLAAPLDSLENTTWKILGNSGVRIAILIGLIALFIYAGGASLIKGSLKK